MAGKEDLAEVLSTPALPTSPLDLDEHVAAVAERVGTVTLDRPAFHQGDAAAARRGTRARPAGGPGRHLREGPRVLDQPHRHRRGHPPGGVEGPARLRHHPHQCSAHRLEPVHAGEPFAARRARAVGVLADPARSAALLADSPEADLPAPRYGIHLVVHTTTDTLTGANEVARLETPTGGAGRAVLAQQVAAWCGQPGARIKVTPVVDLTQPVTVDRYEVGNRLRTRVALQHLLPASSPGAQGQPEPATPITSSPTARADQRQTRTCLLCRRHHRLKTKSAWTYQTLDTGTWLWTDPHRLTYSATTTAPAR